jgi:predicted outer membrane repeat protein
LIVPIDYPTIQAAIDASSDDDTVLVVAGVYTGSGSEVIKTRGRAITIQSLAGADVTTIDGEGLRRVVTCSNSESSSTVIDGFTITGGTADWGGGIYCGGVSPTFTNCIITDNTATTRGGGAYTFQGSPTFTGCSWISNTSVYGGGLYSSNASPQIVGGAFENNTATESGGAIYGSSGNLTITDTSLCHNLPSHISGQWIDGGNNTLTDSCQGCPGDIGEADSIVNSTDVQALLVFWGSSNVYADLDGNGLVGIEDLLIMLTSWGPC